MPPDRAPRTLAELCEFRADTHGDRPALRSGDVTVTYGQLATQARAVARLLVGRGVGPGDKVVVIGRNSTSWVVAAFGCLLAGAALVPLGHGTSPADRKRVVSSLSPRLVMAEQGVWPEAVGQGLSVLSFGDLADLAPSPEPCPPVRPDDVALYLGTSGTTGPVQFIPMTHGQLIRLYGDTCRLVDVGEHDRLLGAVPLAHSFGFNGVLLLAFLAGAYVRLTPTYDRHLLSTLVREDRLTVIAGPPTVFHDLESSSRSDEDWAPRLAITGSTEVSATEIRACCDSLGIPEIVAGYGMTETCGTVAIGRIPRLPESQWPLMSPLPGVAVAICDHRGVQLPPGIDGRILVQGYNVSGTSATETVVGRPGPWFDTGDVGRLDAEGKLTVVARRRDVIFVSGFNVYPAEVETALGSHPGVADVAVIGIPDPRQGERLVGIVVPSDRSLDPSQLIRHCRLMLAAYKVPHQYVMVEGLPRTATGKVLRAKLRDMVDGGC